jgi:hypothetical protein
METRFGTLTPAAALERLQRLLDDIAWSAAQDAELPGGDVDAGQLDALAARLQQVIDGYVEDTTLTIDLDEDDEPLPTREVCPGVRQGRYDYSVQRSTIWQWEQTLLQFLTQPTPLFSIRLGERYYWGPYVR